MPLSVLSLMESPEVASKYLRSATGVFFCVAEVGGFLGPFGVGFLVDVFGTFAAGGLFLPGLGLMIFGLMYLLEKNHYMIFRKAMPSVRSSLLVSDDFNPEVLPVTGVT